MEIEVGMYVRTLDGISKIIELRDKGVMERFVNEDGNVYFLHDILGKPSYKIIDLIGVGDYVNSLLIEDIYKREKDRLLCFCWNKEIMFEINSNSIQTILTKEQFEREAYYKYENK